MRIGAEPPLNFSLPFGHRLPKLDVVLRVVHGERAHNVAFHPTQPLLATVSYDNTVLLHEIPSGRVTARFVHEESVYGVAFSPSGPYMATGTHSGVGRVWNLQTEQVA